MKYILVYILAFFWLYSCSIPSSVNGDYISEVPGITTAPTNDETLSVNQDFIDSCTNEIGKVTVWTRGQLISRDLFLPKRAILNLSPRSNELYYPISVTLNMDCISGEIEGKNCLQEGERNSFHVSDKETTRKILENIWVKSYFFRPVHSNVVGLEKYEFDRNSLENAVDRGDIDASQASYLEKFYSGGSLYVGLNTSYHGISVLAECNMPKKLKGKTQCLLRYNHDYGLGMTDLSDEYSLDAWTETAQNFSNLITKMLPTGEYADAC